MPSVVEGYCRRCDAERPVLVTVPWQADTCSVCGAEDVET